MSHIDSFKHQIIGYFGNIPVYRPLEDIDGEFKCAINQLVLGGGSGEHPAMVIRQPLTCVACFLQEMMPELELSKSEKKRWKSAVSDHVNWEHTDVLAFYDWDIKTYHDFYELCNSNCLCNPYMNEGYSIEQWLMLGFGEFIFYAMPELAHEIISQLRQPRQYFFHVRYNNILLNPPNMPVYANGGAAFKSVRNEE